MPGPAEGVVTEVYLECRPVRALAPFVECGWVRSSVAGAPLRVIPDGCVDVFVTAEGAVMVSGPTTTAYDLGADPGGLLAGLRLRPGAAAAVIGHPVSELRDDHFAIDSVFGLSAPEVADEVLAATTPHGRVANLEALLAGHVATAEPTLDRSVARAVELLRRRPASPVSEVAAAVGLSERQLRRRFDVAVGYGPKRLGRVFRLQLLLDVIHAREQRIRWAEVAIEAGYADQSHMINECLALTGSSPTTLPGAGAAPRPGTSVSSNTGGAVRP